MYSSLLLFSIRLEFSWIFMKQSQLLIHQTHQFNMNVAWTENKLFYLGYHGDDIVGIFSTFFIATS